MNTRKSRDISHSLRKVGDDLADQDSRSFLLVDTTQRRNRMRLVERALVRGSSAGIEASTQEPALATCPNCEQPVSLTRQCRPRAVDAWFYASSRAVAASSRAVHGWPRPGAACRRFAASWAVLGRRAVQGSGKCRMKEGAESVQSERGSGKCAE